jgi:hypothetical protein
VVPPEEEGPDGHNACGVDMRYSMVSEQQNRTQQNRNICNCVLATCTTRASRKTHDTNITGFGGHTSRPIVNCRVRSFLCITSFFLKKMKFDRFFDANEPSVLADTNELPSSSSRINGVVRSS